MYTTLQTYMYTMCCSQVITRLTFKSQQRQKIYKLINEVNCFSSYVMYLMECRLCKKQYAKKAETLFNIRLNTHIGVFPRSIS